MRNISILVFLGLLLGYGVASQADDPSLVFYPKRPRLSAFESRIWATLDEKDQKIFDRLKFHVEGVYSGDKWAYKQVVGRCGFRVDEFVNGKRNHMYLFRSPHYYEVRFVEEEIAVFRRRPE